MQFMNAIANSRTGAFMEEVNISFRGTEEYRRKIQHAALDRGVKVQVLLERAVEAYLNGDSTNSPEGYELLMVRTDMAAVLRAMADWLESSGREKVLEALQAAKTSPSTPSTIESPADGQADRGGKKVRLKPA
jgi:urease accessory protein UreE